MYEIRWTIEMSTLLLDGLKIYCMHAHSVSGEELLGRLSCLYAPTAMRIHMVPGASYAPLIIVSPHLIVFVPLLYLVWSACRIFRS